RHTRWPRDWSSDVCSSDLHAIGGARFEVYRSKTKGNASPVIGAATDDARPKPAKARAWSGGVRFAVDLPCAVRRRKFVVDFAAKIGRASCRKECRGWWVG